MQYFLQNSNICYYATCYHYQAYAESCKLCKVYKFYKMTFCPLSHSIQVRQTEHYYWPCHAVAES